MNTAGWVSLASADLLLSLRAPRGWSVQPVDETRFVLLRDGEDGDGYRASMTFLEGEPEEQGAAWFERFCEAVPDELAASLDGFVLCDSDLFRNSSGARVLALTYRQHAAGAPATSHVQAYMWANSYRMYVASGATLREHEERDAPVFDRILRSVRLLPQRRTHD